MLDIVLHLLYFGFDGPDVLVGFGGVVARYAYEAQLGELYYVLPSDFAAQSVFERFEPRIHRLVGLFAGFAALDCLVHLVFDEQFFERGGVPVEVEFF